MTSKADAKPTPEAFRFSAPLAFSDTVTGGKQSTSEHRVTVHARTPDIVNHWYWGRIVHDMNGCKHRDRIPFDWRHDPDVALGYADTIKASVTDGLIVSGPLQSIGKGDRASEVIERGRLGHPFEASIYWDEADNRLEHIDDGFSATVNGRLVHGPVVIAREWTLRAVAITPHGVDGTTSTKFSKGKSTTETRNEFADTLGWFMAVYGNERGAAMCRDGAKPPSPEVQLAMLRERIAEKDCQLALLRGA
ncbi:hypothetical protein [Rosistilla oblonga]|uniref:hypothetical protein n=1 Tax=Rosistilla oblonga TaxID=2527990 RepID=UPI003A984FB5